MNPYTRETIRLDTPPPPPRRRRRAVHLRPWHPGYATDQALRRIIAACIAVVLVLLVVSVL